MNPRQDELAAQPVRVLTIGVYGFTEEGFFGALTKAGVDLFCDIRRRRGLRGSTYSFANRRRLQEHLASLGIRYLYMQDLAPSEAVRNVQRNVDNKQDINKRDRAALSAAFVHAYREECMHNFDSHGFLKAVGAARVIALFCVEREPGACHRSIVAERLCDDLRLAVEHITP